METTDTQENTQASPRASRAKVYELGYLILPTTPEEHLASEVQNIKSVIERHEGVFVTEDFPKLRPLAYTMRKTSAGQNQKFDRAYFGWIKFEISPNAVPVMHKELEQNANILRFMIISTVRENTLYTQKTTFRQIQAPESPKAEKPEEAPKMTEEEMDKTIENLVVE